MEEHPSSDSLENSSGLAGTASKQPQLAGMWGKGKGWRDRKEPGRREQDHVASFSGVKGLTSQAEPGPPKKRANESREAPPWWEFQKAVLRQAVYHGAVKAQCGLFRQREVLRRRGAMCSQSISKS